MLLLHSRTGEICRAPVDLGGNALPPDLVWIDLLKPSPEEVAFVERATGLELPNYEALSEIESSSRLRAVNGALFLSAPLVYRSDADDPQATPVGFILTQEHFITVRFETPTAFTTAAQTPSPTPHDAFAGLLAAIAARREPRPISASFCAGSGAAAISDRSSATACWGSAVSSPMSRTSARPGFPPRRPRASTPSTRISIPSTSTSSICPTSCSCCSTRPWG